MVVLEAMNGYGRIIPDRLDLEQMDRAFNIKGGESGLGFLADPLSGDFGDICHLYRIFY